ncbi:MAG: Smr/MutS family protein [Pseudomonadota bacterium]
MSRPSKEKDSKQKQDLSALNSEDAKVWERFASSVDPLRNQDTPSPSKTSQSVSAQDQKSEFAQLLSEEHSGVNRAVVKDNKDVPVKVDVSRKKPQKPKPIPELTSFNTKDYRKVGRQQHEIDATLDLHGYRQDQAYTKLKRFLVHAQTIGARYVLVITGKGRQKSSYEDDDLYLQSSSQYGVLRQAVPQWLQEDEFRKCVVGFAPAHGHNGGEGALYVHIRKKKA